MTDLPRTPEGRLIRRARERAIPKLTVRAAAARIGMSAEQWGYAERGYLPRRGDAPEREFHPPKDTLARMATAIGISPGRLEDEGERPDAAEILREIELEQAAPPPPHPDVMFPEPDDAAARMFPDDETKRLIWRAPETPAFRERLIAHVERMRREDRERTESRMRGTTSA